MSISKLSKEEKICMYEYTYAYVSSKKGAYLEFHRTDRSYELHNGLKSEKSYNLMKQD